MQIIGITGQTGAGKSSVCRLLQSRGFYHIDADTVAKSLYEKGSPILEALVSTFGSQILSIDGTLDKKMLALTAFSSEEQKEKLNAIVHPAVTEKIHEILETQEKLGTKGVILDAIALFESGENTLCEMTIGVIAPQEIRLSRIMKRDGITEGEALLRMRAQPEEQFYISKCDRIIRNFPPYVLEEEVAKLFPQ